MKKIRIEMVGTTPLLMHNGRLADPLDPATKALKAITSKRSKTDDDYEAMGEAEFMGSLYLDDVVGPYIPGANVFGSLVGAAKLNRLGTTITRGMIITTEVNPVGYSGPRDPVEMWKTKQFSHRATVKNQANRVVRTRPIFREWALEAEGMFDESQLDFGQIVSIAENAGQFIGLGDWRPRFGRYIAKVEEV